MTKSMDNKFLKIGYVLFTIGTLFTGISMFMDTTVSSESKLGFSTGRIHNQGKLNEKSAYAETGGALLITGALFIARFTQ